MKRYLDKIFFEKSAIYQIRIIGIFLTVVGILFLFNNKIINIKIGTTLILIGILAFFLVIKEKEKRKANSIQITLLVIVSILFVFFISKEAEFQTYFTLITLSILSIKLLTDEFTQHHFKKRLDIVVLMLVAFFFIFIAQKIINFFNI